MTKKSAERLIRFATPASAQPQATRSLKRVAKNKRKLYVEVPESVHHAVRFKALELRKTVTEYILELLEARKLETAGVSPFPSAPGQKRLVLDLPAEKADKIAAIGESAGSFRQAVLACLELDGIQFPRVVDEQLMQGAAAVGQFVADHYGKTLDDDATRAAWALHCRICGKDERYQNDDANFRAFSIASKRTARETIKAVDEE